MKRRMDRALALLLCAALLLGLSGCILLPDNAEPGVRAFERSLFLMDTQMDLRVYGPEDGSSSAALDELAALLTELDARLSVTNPDSALSALNRSGASSDRELLLLVSEARRLHARSGGALEISLYPASLLWGFTAGSYRVPAQEELEALRPRIGTEKLSLSDTELTLAEGMQLDLGALAKGYAADRCRERMEELKLSGILNLGGNIQTVGDKPDGSDWVIGIRDPDDAGAYLLTLNLSGSCAVVTSGDYQRYFEEDGVRYCHILDPQTLRPAQSGLRSVTVVAERGLTADGLATALFVLGREKALELWRSAGDFEAVFLSDDGSVTVTPGLKDRVAGHAFEVAEP